MTTEAAGPVWARELPVALFPFLDLPQVPLLPPLPHINTDTGRNVGQFLIALSGGERAGGSVLGWDAALGQQLEKEDS